MKLRVDFFVLKGGSEQFDRLIFDAFDLRQHGFGVFEIGWVGVSEIFDFRQVFGLLCKVRGSTSVNSQGFLEGFSDKATFRSLSFLGLGEA